MSSRQACLLGVPVGVSFLVVPFGLALRAGNRSITRSSRALRLVLASSQRTASALQAESASSVGVVRKSNRRASRVLPRIIIIIAVFHQIVVHHVLIVVKHRSPRRRSVESRSSVACPAPYYCAVGISTPGIPNTIPRAPQSMRRGPWTTTVPSTTRTRVPSSFLM